MNKKTIIYLVIGFAIAYAIGYIYLKGLAKGTTLPGETPSTSSASKAVPTIEELIAKGYEESEARQVQAALAAGTINGY